ncbi:PITH domain-containing protein 1 [Taenia solium]|eukprot:TsM_000558200 transcript=TsM_000558200 gene=TsM_000558200
MCDSHGHCEHAHVAEDAVDLYSLYKFIDMENLVCLNESAPDSGKKVFKPFEERKDSSVFVESDVDEELLFNIPFTGSVKLKGIIIAGENGDTHPSSVAIYKNRPFMTFSDTEAEADQCLELHPDPTGEITYPLKVLKFGNVQHLGLHIRKNFGAECTRIHYIGLKGDFIQARRQEIVITNYEVKPNVADHKLDMLKTSGHLIE